MRRIAVSQPCSSLVARPRRRRSSSADVRARRHATKVIYIAVGNGEKYGGIERTAATEHYAAERGVRRLRLAVAVETRWTKTDPPAVSREASLQFVINVTAC